MEITISKRIASCIINIFFCLTVIGIIINIILINKQDTSIGGKIFKYKLNGLEKNRLAYIVLSVLQLNGFTMIVNLVMINKWNCSFAENMLDIKKVKI